MAIYAILKSAGQPRASADDRIETLFSGGRAGWREVFEALLQQVRTFGGDVSIASTDTYVSLLRGSRKFAVVQPGARHMDIGVKRPGTQPTGRFAAAGAWNAMVTHRVRITDAQELDPEVLDWLRLAYAAAASGG